MWKSSCPRQSHRLSISSPRPWAGVLVLLLGAAWGSFAQEQVLLKVVLNTVDKGEYFLQMMENGDVLFPADILHQLGIRDTGRQAANKEGAVSLRSLSPDIAFTVEEGSATIFLTVSPALLPVQTLDFAVKSRPDVLYPDESSLFLNYSLDFTSPEPVLDVPLELGHGTEAGIVRLGPRGEPLHAAHRHADVLVDLGGGHARRQGGREQGCRGEQESRAKHPSRPA